jgi:hypothetical protein
MVATVQDDIKRIPGVRDRAAGATLFVLSVINAQFGHFVGKCVAVDAKERRGRAFDMTGAPQSDFEKAFFHHVHNVRVKPAFAVAGNGKDGGQLIEFLFQNFLHGLVALLVNICLSDRFTLFAWRHGEKLP